MTVCHSVHSLTSHRTDKQRKKNLNKTENSLSVGSAIWIERSVFAITIRHGSSLLCDWNWTTDTQSFQWSGQFRQQGTRHLTSNSQFKQDGNQKSDGLFFQHLLYLFTKSVTVFQHYKQKKYMHIRKSNLYTLIALRKIKLHLKVWFCQCKQYLGCSDFNMRWIFCKKS